MNLKIDKDGVLFIERINVWVPQICRFTNVDTDDDRYFCSHSCPLFGEPNNESGLELCKVTLTGDITDERTNE